MIEFGYFLLGAIIALAISVFFYMRSGEELRREAKELRKLHELTMYILTNPKAAIEPKRDKEGNIVGVIVSATGSASGRASAKGELTLTPATTDESKTGA